MENEIKFKPSDDQLGWRSLTFAPATVFKAVYRNGLRLSTPEDYIISNGKILFDQWNAFASGDIYIIITA